MLIKRYKRYKRRSFDAFSHIIFRKQEKIPDNGTHLFLILYYLIYVPFQNLTNPDYIFSFISCRNI